MKKVRRTLLALAPLMTPVMAAPAFPAEELPILAECHFDRYCNMEGADCNDAALRPVLRAAPGASEGVLAMTRFHILPVSSLQSGAGTLDAEAFDQAAAMRLRLSVDLVNGDASMEAAAESAGSLGQTIAGRYLGRCELK